MAEKIEPRRADGATGAEKPCHATAAGFPTLAQPKARAKHAGLYYIEPEGGEPFTIEAKGRNAWALNRLIAAGATGVTPTEEPAGPRWSSYIFNLRKMGVPIETLTEIHDGQFPGKHGRYVLRAGVLKGGSV
ncbi:hypothetical protein XMM379_001963 [Aliiroseovarius sp. xm-m-379]|uniref:winged helix domain-containing protein n=1 Tax=unclassified Aliiroseovarius TaxID=2623558 RepID=UPI0019D9D32D|nr:MULTISPECIES: hypothetical protein [unclassified Aliiroseovarius]NRP25268.1 hypothetical protein [Aliiroseovarius sp. xm-m-379]NRP34067.1 hypothetical protein [Aliiroseovarius sp. xm-a-104]NRP50754.1 hypothetical protein [Aliiroseovarius sp. xm-m-354]NRQ05506.1 hypothetical protein [Aliiroseovarius sp. xm-m-309]NRQ08711.1 hypothetical protein [Aliiroseovarius sp. xm-v-201]